MCPTKKTYDMVYSPDALGISTNEEVSRRHRWLVHKMRRLPYAKWDTVAMILNILVILYSPDLVQLDDPAEAERIQVAYAGLLYK